MRADVTSINVEKRTFEIMWSTGAKVLRSSWYDGQFWEELSMDPKAIRMGRLNSGTAPFLMDHNRNRVVDTPGVVESARIEGGKGYAVIRMCSEGIDPEADKLFAKIADKVVRNVSVGYRTYAVEKTEGINTKVPTIRATDWEPHEISSVTVGAEHGAGVRSDDPAQLHEVTITHRFTTNEEPTMTPEEIKALQEKQASEARALELKTAADLAVKLDRERSAGITHACKALGPDGAERAAKLIADEKMTLDGVRKLVLDELATRDVQDAPTTHARVTGVAGGDERDKLVRGISAAIFANSGRFGANVAEAQKRGLAGFSKAEVDLDPAQFRGMKLSDISRMFAERGGKSTRGIFGNEQLFDLAKRASTTDFAVLFENVMYKLLRAAYGVQPSTWRRWVGIDSVKDFRNSNRFMKGAFSNTLPVVLENAEYQQIAIPDGAKLAIQTETRGGTIGISRQAIINDDMGALASLASDFGALAADTLEAEAYRVLLLNGGLGPTVGAAPFFDDAVNANVATTSVLGVAGLGVDKAKMRAQVRGNSYIDQNPRILLVPVGLEDDARILNESATDHTTALDGKPNLRRGMFGDIVSSPRITGTRRYLFSEAKEAFKMVFLEGSGEGPTMSSEEGFLTDGMTWKARIDAKMVPFDPKTAVTSAGTA